MSDELDNRIEELLALAVLGELSPTDEVELDAALAADAEMTAELDADLSVAATLQATLMQDPPASMKSNVMAAIDALGDAARQTAQTDVSPQPASSPFGPPEGPLATAPLPKSDVVDFATERTKRRGGKWQPLAAAAAVVMLLVGGVLVANRGGDGGSTFEAIATADDAQERTFDGELVGTLSVVYSPSQDAFVLVGSDIPILIDAETYQLWFVDGEGTRSVGLFRPDDDGRVQQVFGGLDPTDVVVGVTIEPASGSDTPTIPIIAAA